MHPNRFLPIFLLAVAGMDFLLAMHPETGGAAHSEAASNTKTETHHPVDYERTVDNVRVGSSGEPTEFLFVDTDNVRVGSSGEPTEFLFVDTHETIALNYGPEYHLKLKDVQIRLGDKQFQSAISKHKHKSPSAARIELTLDEQQNPDLKTPKDLEGIELEIVYGFGEDCENPGCPDHGIPHINWMDSLSNGTNEKKVTVKIPKMENAPTEKEKELLKGIFIGGYKFRVKVLSDGNAEIKFQKNLSPGTMKFIADYTKVRTGNGEMVEVSYREGKNWGLDFESISLPKSTFTINWATAGIKEVEELRAVRIDLYFKFKDGEGKHNKNKVTESELGGLPLLRQIKLRDLEEDILEQLFVGGQLATIHLSGVDYGENEMKIGAAPVTKPKSNLTPGTMKFTASYRNFWSKQGQMVNPPFAHRKDYEFENISLPESTFNINWAKSKIKEAEELRTVRMGIELKLEDGEYMKVPEDQRGVYSRTVSFQNLSNDILEELFVGGETTIHLSTGGNGKSGIEIVASPKPKSMTAFEKVKAKVGFGMS